MQPTLYVKRDIREGMPKREGQYLVFCKEDHANEEYIAVSQFRYNTFIHLGHITHWLEPVEWPTEEEINAWIEDLDFIGLERTAAEGMAHWLLSRLEKGK